MSLSAYTRRLQQIGGSLMICIPKEILTAFDVTKNTVVIISKTSQGCEINLNFAKEIHAALTSSPSPKPVSKPKTADPTVKPDPDLRQQLIDRMDRIAEWLIAGMPLPEAAAKENIREAFILSNLHKSAYFLQFMENESEEDKVIFARTRKMKTSDLDRILALAIRNREVTENAVAGDSE